MKIFFLIGKYGQGGAEKQLMYIANYLSNNGHQVSIISIFGGDNLYKNILRQDIKCHDISEKYKYKSLVNLNRTIFKENPDIVISFLFHATILSRILSIFHNFHSISSYRNETYGTRFRDFIIKYTCRLDKLTISNSSSAKRMYSGEKNGFIVIPNSYDHHEDGQQSEPATYESNTKEIFFGYIGRLEKQKNIEAIIKALHRLVLDEKHNCKLIIVGDGSDKLFLKRIVYDLGLINNVAFVGRVEDTGFYLNQLDALILASLWEGMPNSLVEAIYSKVSVISTAVGAVPDIIRDKYNGFIINDSSYTGVYSAMLSFLMTSDENITFMRDNALSDINSICHPVHVENQWIKVINSIGESK